MLKWQIQSFCTALKRRYTFKAYATLLGTRKREAYFFLDTYREKCYSIASEYSNMLEYECKGRDVCGTQY